MPVDLDIFIKLVLSVVLGGVIGWERETHGRAAGLRTHILVSLGSCLIMLTSIFIFDAYKTQTSCDPARIAAGVVTGIGFLGAGTILRYRASVIGLTTAASVWAVSAIGLAVGVGFYYASIVTTLLVILTLWLVAKFEKRLIRKNLNRGLILESKIDAKRLHKIKSLLENHQIEIKDFDVEKLEGSEDAILRFDIKLTSHKNDDTIIIELLKLDGVSKARWE